MATRLAALRRAWAGAFGIEAAAPQLVGYALERPLNVAERAERWEPPVADFGTAAIAGRTGGDAIFFEMAAETKGHGASEKRAKLSAISS